MKNFQHNLIEFINGCFLTGIIVFLFAVSSKNKWTDPAVTWFMSIITINILIIISILIIKFNYFSILVVFALTVFKTWYSVKPKEMEPQMEFKGIVKFISDLFLV